MINNVVKIRIRWNKLCRHKHASNQRIKQTQANSGEPRQIA